MIAVTKHLSEVFQEPHGHLYPSFDMKRFASVLQSDKKLPIIWHRGNNFPSQQPVSRPVHFIKSQESQLSDLGLKEEAL